MNIEWQYADRKTTIKVDGEVIAEGKEADDLLDEADRECDRTGQSYISCLQNVIKKRRLK